MKKADLIMGYSCNLNCSFCMGEPGKRSKNYPFSVLKSAVIELKKKGYEGICFSGGEPTIRKCLIELVKLAKCVGFAEIKLQTNGLMLSRKDYLKNLMEAGITSVGITVCSAEEDVYDGEMGLPGAYKILLKALRSIKEEEISAEADVVVSKFNFIELDSIISLVAGYGIKGINFKFACSEGNAKKNMDKIVPKIGYIAPKVKQAADLCSEKGIKCSIQYMPWCILPSCRGCMLDISNMNLGIAEGERIFDFKDGISETHIKPELCKSCKDNEKCPGVGKEYAKKHGIPELKPSK